MARVLPDEIQRMIAAMPPRVSIEALPAEEHDLGDSVNHSLTAMDSHLRNFRAAVALFDFCRAHSVRSLGEHAPDGAPPSDMTTQWSFIAARDGAITIYHFHSAMDAARECAGASPTIRGALNWPAVRAVMKLFRSRFPEFLELRHAVAHSEDLARNPQQQANNRIRGPYTSTQVRVGAGASVTIVNSLMNNTFSTTIGGRLVSYNVTPKTTEDLERIMLKFYAVFRAN